MEASDTLDYDVAFEALPQRVDANKDKRRRKGGAQAAAAAAAAGGGQPEASTAAAAEHGATAEAHKSTAAAAAAAVDRSGGFGLHNIEGQQHLADLEQQQQRQQHVQDVQQYRSAAVGAHKFECECLQGLLPAGAAAV
jgi:hypothetical protein